MGCIGRGLCDFLQPLAGRIIQNQRQYDGDGEAEHQLVKADYQCIFQQLPEHGRGKKLPEILEAHPFTAPDSFGRHKILKGYLQPRQRHVIKNENVDDHGKQK